ncbi:hypothetical protein [Pedobacter sp. L105]|uniref:MutS-related protein n=1 Tax=Pedobacter sp. L105 TaxID=1641871 RepID=UPI00131C306E|nr:hypothetical protein [Pedobacter sp. L105]
MSFNIDNQTYRDLNIFDSYSEPIYNMFKGTRTLGARDLLKAIMQNPSTDIQYISSRRDAIKYFFDNKLSLEIKNENLDLIEFYLNSNGRKSEKNLIDSFVKYVTKNSSNDYYIIKTGLKNLIKLVKYISTFNLEIMAKDDVPDSLIKISEKIKSIIEVGLLCDAIRLNEDTLNFYQITKLDHAFRGEEKDKIFEFLQIVYEFDVLESLALTTKKKGLCFPEYIDGDDINVSIISLFHPQIPNPVKNDIVFKREDNILFLTGSNMSGKSSLLKSLGLIIYLSHLGFPVPATAMKTTIFNGLITTINLPDDINQGLSHYYSEVKRVKQIASALLENDKMFIILDELFKGTNVKDAFDASLLIISELTHIHNSVFLISTHIMELAEVLNKYKNISFKYLDTSYEEKKVRFTYKLTDGISSERLGMFIVENEGIVDIIKKASYKQKK